MIKKTNKYKKELVSRWKLMKGCNICNYKKSSASLFLRHTKPETKWNVNLPNRNHFSQGSNRGSIRPGADIPEIKLTLSKCKVLCANCSGERGSK